MMMCRKKDEHSEVEVEDNKGWVHTYNTKVCIKSEQRLD